MNKVKLVCEIGINHNGNLEIAKRLIKIAESFDCDYVKLQKRTVDLVYTKEELDKPRDSPWGKTNREQKYGLEFGPKEYGEINVYCKINNIGWFASPWDVKSVEFLPPYRPAYMKVPSALITNFTLLEAIKKTNIPVIISTGMSTKDEVDKCVEYLGDQLEYILACNSQYPTPKEDMNLNHIKTLKECYIHHKIGFSNHNPGILFCIAAATLGAEMLEFHVTLDRASYGTDQPASIEPGGIMKISKYVRDLEKAMGTGEWIISPGEEIIRKKLRR